MGHSRTTVGLTRGRGATIIAGPPVPCGLIGMVQKTVYAYHFSCTLPTGGPTNVLLPFDPSPQDIAEAMCPMKPVTRSGSARRPTLVWWAGAFPHGASRPILFSKRTEQPCKSDGWIALRRTSKLCHGGTSAVVAAGLITHCLVPRP